MSNDALLDSLFPSTRKAVLSATLTQPEKWWFLSELAEFLSTTPSSLQRDLSSLVESGVLEKRREGTRAYFRAQKLSPVFTDLKNIFEKTTGVIPTVRSALTPFEQRIASAFIYGSIARGTGHATSDIDLAVIGGVGLAELAPVLRKRERSLGREINATVLSVAEFRQSVAQGDHFLLSLLKRPKQFVKGSQRELDAITRT